MPNKFEQPSIPSPEENYEEEEKETIEGDNFTMKRGNPWDFDKTGFGPALEFRPGENSETARIREEKEKAEEIARERLRKEYQKNQAEKMTPEEKARQKEKEEQKRYNYVVEWFEDGIRKNGEYSETIGIKKDGSLDTERRFDDGRPPFITMSDVVPGKDLNHPEDLYRLMYEIEQKCPQFNVLVEIDPKRKWIKYSVSEKSRKEGGSEN